MSAIANLFLFKIILRPQIQTTVLFSLDRFLIYVSSCSKLYLNFLIKRLLDVRIKSFTSVIFVSGYCERIIWSRPKYFNLQCM